MKKISDKLRKGGRSSVRSQIKARLAHLDPLDEVELDFADIEADAREMGIEQWGTWSGLEFTDLEELAEDEEDLEERKEQRRKERRK
jgi:hypothetical protein